MYKELGIEIMKAVEWIAEEGLFFGMGKPLEGNLLKCFDRFVNCLYLKNQLIGILTDLE